MRPAFENPPIIKLSFIFRRGLKMKLVRDKPAEPFRRFCLFSLRVPALRCVSLSLFLFSVSSSPRYSFSTICLDLLHPLTPPFSSLPPPFSSLRFLFSRIQRAMTHSLRWLPSFSMLHYTLLTQNDVPSFNHRSLCFFATLFLSLEFAWALWKSGKPRRDFFLNPVSSVLPCRS